MYGGEVMTSWTSLTPRSPIALASTQCTITSSDTCDRMNETRPARSSAPSARRRARAATTSVVPKPANGSTTRSPGRVYFVDEGLYELVGVPDVVIPELAPRLDHSSGDPGSMSPDSYAT